AERSFAAASAPDRAERNTGLVELLAMSATLRCVRAGADPAAEPPPGEGDGVPPPQAIPASAIAASTVPRRATRMRRLPAARDSTAVRPCARCPGRAPRRR